MLFRRAVATIRCGRLFATHAEVIVPAPAPPGYSSVTAGAAWTRRAPPFVWHPELSIPWPVTHRFAMWKFDDLRRELVAAGLVTSETELFAPKDEAGNRVLDEAIRRAHSQEYISAIENNTLEVSLWRRIGFVARPDHALLMRRTRLEIAGTLRARDLALKHGLACHLGGGTHHAHRTYGSGYTIYNDLAVAALDTCVDPTARVLIVDLDVHQGDGTAQILEGHDRCFTWSVHCAARCGVQHSPSLLETTTWRRLASRETAAGELPLRVFREARAAPREGPVVAGHGSYERCGRCGDVGRYLCQSTDDPGRL